MISITMKGQTHTDDQFSCPGVSVDGEPCQAIGNGVTLHIARLNYHLDTWCGSLIWVYYLNLEKTCSQTTVRVSTTLLAGANYLQIFH